MSEDYRNGFKDGFEGGFALGLEEGKRNQNLNPVPSYHLDPAKSPSVLLKETCPKCGITIGGVMNYACQSINCPTFYRTWSSPSGYNNWSADSQGAVGSTVLDTDAPGANGPRGPSEPIDYSMR